MPRPPAHLDEVIVRGRDIGLPLVETIGAFASQSASRITWHSHRRFELLLLLNGATVYEFAGGQTIELPGGHMLITPPGAKHRGLHDVRMPAAMCGIVFDPFQKDATKNAPFTAADLRWMSGQFEQGALRSHTMGPELRKLAAALKREVLGAQANPVSSIAVDSTSDESVPQKGAKTDRFPKIPAAAKSPLQAPTLRLLACAALLEAARQLTVAERVESRQAIAAVVRHMEAHYADRLHPSDLAHQAGCGRARFFQLFKQSTGMTPNDYLQRLRVNKARSLLKESNESITTIAFAAGFSSSQYFCNVFRKYTGIAPGEFRGSVRTRKK